MIVLSARTTWLGVGQTLFTAWVRQYLWRGQTRLLHSHIGCLFDMLHGAVFAFPFSMSMFWSSVYSAAQQHFDPSNYESRVHYYLSGCNIHVFY